MVMQAWRRAWRGMVGLVGRPARRAQGHRGAGQGGIVIQPYRGYGNRREVFLIGRVFRQAPPGRRDGPLLRLWRDVGRRLTRRAVPDVEIAASFGGGTCETRTDADGYFRLHLTLRQAPPDDCVWHDVALSLSEPEPAEARAEVYIPPPRAQVAVVSDIDDTIMYTGVANKLAMLWRLFVRSADDREAFPGVAVFYEALHKGVEDGGGEDGTGGQGNPILYVSRGPWGIYDILDAFFTAHRIPVGPILFLREWGVSWSSPLPRKAVDHKEDLIEHMLGLYPDLPFVLIGDSGQHDPEVYRRLIADHPGRVRAVYIRNVSKGGNRRQEIEQMAEEAASDGVSLVLAADSAAMAEHAADLGLIPASAVDAVRQAQAVPEQPVKVRSATASRRLGEEAQRNADRRSLRIDPPGGSGGSGGGGKGGRLG